ncbi:hypothetical protein GE21DRAFT_1221239, partial [Neurospora crassa]
YISCGYYISKKADIYWVYYPKKVPDTEKPKKDIIAKKVANVSTSAFTNNASTNFIIPATSTNSTLLYKSRIFIGISNIGSSIDFY